MYHDLEVLSKQALTKGQREVVESLMAQWTKDRYLSAKQRRLVKNICDDVARMPRISKLLGYLSENAHDLSEKHALVVVGFCEAFQKYGGLTPKQFDYACQIADCHVDSKSRKNTKRIVTVYPTSDQAS